MRARKMTLLLILISHVEQNNQLRKIGRRNRRVSFSASIRYPCSPSVNGDLRK